MQYAIMHFYKTVVVNVLYKFFQDFVCGMRSGL